ALFTARDYFCELITNLVIHAINAIFFGLISTISTWHLKDGRNKQFLVTLNIQTSFQSEVHIPRTHVRNIPNHTRFFVFSKSYIFFAFIREQLALLKAWFWFC